MTVSSPALDQPVPQFDLHTGPFADNPYPILDRLREECPVFWHEGLNAWLVTRYDDVRWVINDEAAFVPELPAGTVPGRRNVVVMSGDQHKRYRTLVAPGFALSTLKQTVEPLLAPLAHRFLDDFVASGDGEADLVPTFSNPYPAWVIGNLLQVDELDQDYMRDAEIVLEYAADPSNPEVRPLIGPATARVTAFCDAAVEAQKRERRPGLITFLLDAELDGERLEDDDISAFAAVLTIAGVETTQRLIANLVYALCRYGVVDRVAADRALVAPAIEETLRFHPPNHFRMRYAVVDTEVHGRPVAAGEKLYALTAPANRDPRAFDDADRFVVDRDVKANKHVSFGYGIHLCIGAALARMETRVALEAILDRLERIELAEDPSAVRFKGFRNRSPESLLLRFRRR